MFERKGAPAFPYAGHSAATAATSAASAERTEDEDETGISEYRQARVLGHLISAGPLGMTWVELARAEGWHHGQATGALSVLHKAGTIARLTERRERSSVYVLPAHIGGRETGEHGSVIKERARTAALTAVPASEDHRLRARIDVLVAQVTEYEAAEQVWREVENDLEARLADAEQEVALLRERLHALTLTESEEALIRKVAARLHEVADRPDDATVRVYLSTLRGLIMPLWRFRLYQEEETNGS